MVATAVVRDRFAGRDMAEVMSLIFMVFMAMPIIAPGVGQVLLLTGPWQSIFVFMAGLATLISLWAFFRLPETLHPEYRRELTFKSVTGGFGIVFTNRLALFYGLAGMFLFGAMFGFVSSSQQIFVDIFGLGALFPVAFAAMAGMMAVSSFLNSRIVKRFGMRRLSHFALIVYISGSILLVAFSLAGFMPLWLFFSLLMIVQFVFGWAASNMNSLSMEPLGAGGRHRRFRLRLHPDRGRRAARHDDRPAVQRHDDADRARLPRHGLARAWLRAHRRERQAVRRRQGVRRRPLGLLVDPADAQPVHDELLIRTARSPRRILRRKYFS